MKIYSEFLYLPETQDPAEKESRIQLLRWAVGEMIEQMYKEISEDFKMKDLEITLWIKTGEGGEI